MNECMLADATLNVLEFDTYLLLRYSGLVQDDGHEDARYRAHKPEFPRHKRHFKMNTTTFSSPSSDLYSILCKDMDLRSTRSFECCQCHTAFTALVLDVLE
jgi:hypothetical protein